MMGDRDMREDKDEEKQAIYLFIYKQRPNDQADLVNILLQHAYGKHIYNIYVTLQNV